MHRRWINNVACGLYRLALTSVFSCAVLCAIQALMLMIKEQVHGSAAATLKGLDTLLQKSRQMGQQAPVHMAVRAVTS